MPRYTAETWPDREEGDDARLNLGQIYAGPRAVRPGDRRARVGPATIEPVARGAVAARRRPLGQEPGPRAQGRRHGRRGRGPEGDRCLPGRTQGPPRGRRRADGSWPGRQRRRSRHRADRVGQVGRGPPAPRPDRQGPDRPCRARLLQADGGPAHGLHQHQPGPAGDRHDEDAGAGGGRRQPDAALSQAGQAARARARRPQAEGEHGRLRPDAPILQGLPDDARRAPRAGRPTSRWSGRASGWWTWTRSRRPRRS